MPSVVSCLIPSAEPRQEPFGDPLLDAYLEFLSGRCRPNSVLAARFDLKVFFRVVAKPVEAVTATDVLGFITAQRSGAAHLPDPLLGSGRRRHGRGVAADRASPTVHGRRAVRVPDRPRRRARQPGPARAADPSGTAPADPGGAVGPGAATDAAADPDPGRGRRPHHRVAHAPGPGHGRRDAARRAAALRGPRAAPGGCPGRGAAAVHRRGQGRPPTIRADLLEVLRAPGRLPRAGATRGRRHRRRVPGAQTPPAGPAVERVRPRRGPRRRPREGRAGARVLSRAAAHLPDPAAGGRDAAGGGPGPGRARLDRVDPDLSAPGRRLARLPVPPRRGGHRRPGLRRRTHRAERADRPPVPPHLRDRPDRAPVPGFRRLR